METTGQSQVTKELKMSEMVELVVETEAEVGATGFSVTGGGKEGIFVKEVLKDSRAAKALNLKEGDQLLCAKVYFDNARYEDVVKILQSAEPYKVAFCLKRTVPSADVAISSETGSLELRGPEAKKTKLSVKSISPVKKTKQLMKGKTLNKEEAAVELDVPVDVEFAFPKFSRFKRLSITSPKDAAALKGEGTFRHPEAEAELSLGEGQTKGKKKRLKFPGFRTSDPGKVKVEVGMEPTEKVAVSVKDVEGKTKFKMPSFDLTKKGKAEAPSPKGKEELKDSVKAGVSTDGEAPEGKLKLGLPMQAPKVEIDIGLSKAEVDVKSPSAEGEVKAKGPSFKVKMPSFELKGSEGTDAKGKEAGDQVEGAEAKLKMPAIDISVPKIKQSEEDVTMSGVEIAVGSYKALGLEGKMKELAQKVTTIDISAPKVPDVDICLPRAAADLPVVGAGTGKVDVQTSKITIEGPETRLKMPKVSLPEFGISAKGKEGAVEAVPAAPDVSGPVLKMPKVEVSVPKVKLDEARADVSPATAEAGVSGLHVSKVKMDIKGPQLEGPEAKIKLPSVKVPTIDIAVPKVTLPDVQFPMSKAEVSGPADGKAPKVPGVGEQPDGFDLKLKIPKVSLPKLSAGGREAEVSAKVDADGEDTKLKHPIITLPKFEIAVPGMKPAEAETGPGVEAEVKDSGFTVGKLPSVKMPSIDISAPKVKIPDVNVHLPSGKAEGLTAAGGVKDPKVGVARTGDQPSESSSEVFDLQLKMPKVSLPSFGASASEKEAKGEPSSPEVGAKMPTIDLSVLKVKVPEVDIDVRLPKGKADASELVAGEDASVKSTKTSVASHMPTAATEGPDVTFQIPKVSLPKFDISLKSKETGADTGMKAAEETDGVKSPALKMPKFEVALPKMRSSEAEVSGPTTEADIKRDTKGKIEVESAEAKLKLPSMKMPTIDMSALQVKVPEVDINLPSVKSPFSAEENSKIDSGGHPTGVKIEGPDAKVKMPKISLPKFGSKGKEEVEGDGNMPKVEVKVPHVEGKGKVQSKGKDLDSGVKGVDADADIDDGRLKGKEGRFKMPKIKMPTFGTSKKYEEDVDIPGPTGRTPEVKTKTGSMDSEAEGSAGKLKMPKVQMPSIAIAVPEIRRPGAEVDVSEADLKTYGGELKIPKVKGDVEAADPEGKQKLPSVKMPAIDISVPKVKAPEVDLSFSMPKIDTTVRGTEGEATLISSEADDAAFRLKMPKLGLPKFGVSGSKDKERGADISSSGVSGDYHADDADGKGMSFKARMPKVDISLPKVRQSDADIDMDASLLEIEGPEAEEKFKMPGFTLPKISPPKLKAPELDIDLSLSKDKRLSSGSSDPKVDAEVSGAEFKLKMPQVSLPTFGLSASGTGTNSDGSLSTEKAQPKAKAEVKTQMEGGEGLEGQEDKIIGGKIKMPKFRMTASKDKAVEDSTEATKADAETEGGKLKLKLPKFGISSKSPETEADLEMEGSDGKAKESKLKMSKFGLSLGKGQKAEVGESGQSEGDSQGDKFKVKIPSVTIATPKVKGPDVDLDVSFPKAKDTSVDREAKDETGKGREARVKGETPAPVTISDGSESRFKMPKLTMPDFGIPGSSRKDEDRTAKVKVSDVVVRRSKGEVDIEGPEVESEGRLQMLKVNMPKVEIGLSRDESSAGKKTEIRAGQKPGGDAFGSETMSTKVPFKMPSVEISSLHTSDVSAGVETRSVGIELSPAEGTGCLKEADPSALELKMPKVTLPSFGSSKEKDQEASGDSRSSGAKIDIKGPQVQGDTGDVPEGMLSKLKDKMSKVGVELPKVTQQEEVGLSTEAKGREVRHKSEVGLEGPDAELKTDKTRRQLFGFSVPKLKSPEGHIETSSPKARDRSRSPAAKGDLGGIPAETDSAEAKLRVSKVKKPSFGISWPKSKTMEFNGNGEAGDSTTQTPRKKGTRAEEVDDPDSLDEKPKMKLKLPKVSFTPVKSSPVNITTESPGVHINGDGEESGSPGKMSRIKLPKVEFSSPYQKVRESDTELSLQLVKTEVSASKDDGGLRADQSFDTSSPRVNRGEVRGSKIKAPKITFSAFKKKNGERAGSDEETEMSNLVTSTARTELVLLDSGGDAGHTKSKSILGFTSGKSKELGTSSVTGKEPKPKGCPGDELDGKDKSAKFKLPKLALSAKSNSLEYENNIHSEGQLENEGATRHFKLQMPKVGFTTVYQEEHASEEKIVGDISSVTVSKGKKQVKTGTLADKSTSI
ncbi:neuroblast differentiation-associated protein AHNAK-like [Pristis pectinata]|uniref:neuroblast differentiation-associated protein AHNAK-like n=1 Tax=Pristis pectinata TaxID=685728 RepID=UPI00223DDE35|nr:neuroblast differentiation-associated protein AHNAK-like [Pristis pectinata]XP_051900312.1 neuroblast differentiation-associated protein AHNAK-like [Pristis pectinata]XP_051900313.1 neuroblast differentiation-associated protein AHNAK-like [Pristis pectinata]